MWHSIEREGLPDSGLYFFCHDEGHQILLGRVYKDENGKKYYNYCNNYDEINTKGAYPIDVTKDHLGMFKEYIDKMTHWCEIPKLPEKDIHNETKESAVNN